MSARVIVGLGWAVLSPAVLTASVGPLSPLSPQEATRIEGRVVDASTRAPIAHASVRVLGTVLGVLTDEGGLFAVTGVSPGRYRLRAERIGYAPHVEDVEVPPAGVATLEIALRVAPVELGAIVAAAAKREQTLAEAPVSASVLQAPQVERTTALTVRDAIEYVPSAQFVGDQLNLRGSSGYSRGTGARVLFLIDGVPANASDAGNINWDIVPVAEVERVEVIKGPGSALWGSSALGGVVNVRLSDAPERHMTRFRLLGGFYDSPPHAEWEWTARTLGFGSLEVLHGGPLGPLSGWLRYARARSDGYRENSFSSRTNVSGRARLALGRADTLRAFAAFARERYGSPLLWCVRGQCDDPFGLAYQPLRVDSSAVRDFTRSEKTFASLQWQRPLGPAFRNRVRVSLLINNWISRFGNVGAGASREGATSDRVGGEWQVDARHGGPGGPGGPGGQRGQGGRGVATLGTEWAHTWVRSDLFGRHTVTDGAGYLQEELALARWLTLTGGARVDFRWVDGEFDRGRVSPRVGVVVAPDPLTRLRAAAGFGFRAASVAELFTATQVQGFRVVPNPGLKAETSRALEVGLDRLVADWLSIAATGFVYRYRDFIEPDTVLRASGGIEIQFGNLPRARVQGAETALRWRWPGGLLSGSFAYTYLDARDLTDDRVLAYRPRHLVTAQAALRPGSLELGLDYRYAARFDRVQVWPEDERVAMKVLDLRAGYRFGRYAVLFSGENLLNYSYTTIERNLEPIRSFRVAIQGEF